MTIEELQPIINELQLDDHDELYNVKMPDKSCELCGGNGIKEWDGERSVLCECILANDTNRASMPFYILRGLNNLQKKQVYDE